MDNSVYIALSKQTAAENQLDIIANNIANANTVGFKSEDMAFSTLVQNAGKNSLSYAKQAGTVRNEAAGSFETTGNPLDLAISGKGYFGVQTPAGERYTRAGNFRLNDQGDLVTADGYQVLDTAGQPIQLQPEDKEIKIFDDGRMQIDGEDRSSIGVFKVSPGTLTKAEGNLYASTETGAVDEDSRISQGMLENSNVNPIMEMTKMITVQHNYDGTAQFIDSIYDLQGESIRTLSKTN